MATGERRETLWNSSTISELSSLKLGFSPHKPLPISEFQPPTPALRRTTGKWMQHLHRSDRLSNPRSAEKSCLGQKINWDRQNHRGWSPENCGATLRLRCSEVNPCCCDDGRTPKKTWHVRWGWAARNYGCICWRLSSQWRVRTSQAMSGEYQKGLSQPLSSV